MIVQIPEQYDLCLSYSWGPINQGMCGHLFECIEYYYILKEHYKLCIFIPEKISEQYIRKTIEDKYTFTDDEVNDIISNIIIGDGPFILKGGNLLLVDAGFSKLTNRHLLFNNIMAFPCADMAFKDKAGITVFQDDRLYGTDSLCTTHNYIKKILLDKYRPIGESAENVNLVYATKNARGLDESIYSELSEKYPGDFLLLTNTEIKTKLSDRYTLEEMPVKNLFEKFSTYIYTPVSKKYDCSPRFLVECKYYGKEVIFHEIDYWDIDLGLRWRVHDIEHDYQSLFLRDDDPIVELIGNVVG